MASEAKTVSDQNAASLAHWCRGRVVEEIDPFDDSVSLGVNVPCHDGEVKRASSGHMVIRRHDGTFDVYNPHA